MTTIKEKIKKNLTVENLEKLEYSERFNTDPLTAKEIIAIAITLVEFLTKKDDSAGLKEIYKQLSEINYKLNLIIDYLQKISIQIDEEFKKLIKTKLSAQISSINENLSIWDNQDLKKENIQSEIQNSQTELNISAKQAMEYGYAHYLTMIYALKTELVLLNSNQSINNEKKSIKSTFLFDSYRAYFKNSINENINGSFMNLLIPLEETIRKYELEFIEKNYTLEAKESGDDGRRDCNYYYKLTLTIRGSLKDGFQFTQNEVLTDSKCYPRETRGGHFVPEVLITQSLATQRAELNNIKSRFNQASENYRLHLIPRKIMIDSSIKTIEETILIIDRKKSEIK